MSGPAKAMGIALAVAMTVAVAALSRVPVDGVGAEEALLRLSWKMPGEVVERCRERTAEELERLPAHMRSPSSCEGQATAYRMEVDVDGSARLRLQIEPAGLRGDRPITVLEEMALEPGARRVRVALVPLAAEAISDPLTFEGTVNPDPGDVVLVTLDDQTRRLEARTPGA